MDCYGLVYSRPGGGVWDRSGLLNSYSLGLRDLCVVTGKRVLLCEVAGGRRSFVSLLLCKIYVVNSYLVVPISLKAYAQGIDVIFDLSFHAEYLVRTWQIESVLQT